MERKPVELPLYVGFRGEPQGTLIVEDPKHSKILHSISGKRLYGTFLPYKEDLEELRAIYKKRLPELKITDDKDSTTYEVPGVAKIIISKTIEGKKYDYNVNEFHIGKALIEYVKSLKN
jgi:hypothetical protein